MTRADHEAAVLAYLRENDGFFSIWWATENRLRACALTRLEQRGEIVSDHLERGMLFPHCHARIVDHPEPGDAVAIVTRGAFIYTRTICEWREGMSIADPLGITTVYVLRRRAEVDAIAGPPSGP